ncbi:hypothetical protein [Alkaliphilus metalliredigens]|uniref:hypothetical protein n=1 Tax=Alkaliphilus metalliredigens TaxID=208226 RepID=UPI0002E23D49|nr:hypothetical protein [Alkaliphilus metalliredigens]
MKKSYTIIIPLTSLLKNLFTLGLLLMSSQYLLDSFPVSNYYQYEGMNFSIYQLIHSPGEFIGMFLFFISTLAFASNVTFKGFVFSYLNWTILGFIIKFSLISWNIAILFTTCYLSFYFMSIEGIILFALIIAMNSLIYFNGHFS